MLPPHHPSVGSVWYPVVINTFGLITPQKEKSGSDIMEFPKCHQSAFYSRADHSVLDGFVFVHTGVHCCSSGSLSRPPRNSNSAHSDVFVDINSNESPQTERRSVVWSAVYLLDSLTDRFVTSVEVGVKEPDKGS